MLRYYLLDFLVTGIQAEEAAFVGGYLPSSMTNIPWDRWAGMLGHSRQSVLSGWLSTGRGKLSPGASSKPDVEGKVCPGGRLAPGESQA